jgi:elongator complex protein 3
MGGTFLQYPKNFQCDFIKNCYDALNEKKSKTLEQAQKLNEKAKHRCIALCVETRPDECIKYIKRMREFGVTRVELGVQMLDDKIYKKIKRGHNVKDVADATRELKNAGFKVGYHIMPGLPSSNPKKDLQLFKKIFSDERFKPDQLKIYPCQVIKGSELEEEYWKKKYKPYTKEQTEKLLTEMLKIVPRYCRVMRIMREIPPEYLIAGTTKIDLRKDVEEALRKHKDKIKEIRFREVGFALQHGKELNTNLKLKITKYKASEGDEYFLEIVNDNDILFGLLRLRIINKKAIVRELHVYGQSLKLGEVGKLSQHIGLGKWLMSEAEKIAKENNCKKISVISGIGVREYYKRLGYGLEETYMVKKL